MGIPFHNLVKCECFYVVYFDLLSYFIYFFVAGMDENIDVMRGRV